LVNQIRWFHKFWNGNPLGNVFHIIYDGQVVGKIW